MSVIIKGMKLPQHADVNGEKDTAYKCVILAHPDNSVELVIDTEFASPYDNGHNIQCYPLTEIPTPHGRLIDADRLKSMMEQYHCNGCDNYNGARCSACCVDDCFRYIDDIPTIIEAEE